MHSILHVDVHVNMYIGIHGTLRKRHLILDILVNMCIQWGAANSPQRTKAHNMTTSIVELSPDAWSDVTTELSLVDDETYIAQVVGGGSARLLEAATTPATNTLGFIMHNQQDAWSFTQATGLYIYLRSDGINGTSIAVNKVGA